MTKQALLAKNCQRRDAALPLEVIEHYLQFTDGWQIEFGFLTRNFQFKDFHEMVAFMNAVAYIIHREDHHPEVRISYNQCKIHYNTHSVGGISENDFICAVKIDAVYAHRFV